MVGGSGCGQWWLVAVGIGFCVCVCGFLMVNGGLVVSNSWGDWRCLLWWEWVLVVFNGKKRNTHRERDGEKERGRDEIWNKKELENNKEIIF